MARFIAEDVLIVLVSCCSLLFEGGWERDGAPVSYTHLTLPMAFKKNDFLI